MRIWRAQKKRQGFKRNAEDPGTPSARATCYPALSQGYGYCFYGVARKLSTLMCSRSCARVRSIKNNPSHERRENAPGFLTTLHKIEGTEGNLPPRVCEKVIEAVTGHVACLDEFCRTCSSSRKIMYFTQGFMSLSTLQSDCS